MGFKIVENHLLTARKITEQNTGRFTFTDQNGNYSLVVLDSGNFTVSPQSVNWYNPAPVSHIRFLHRKSPNRFPQRFCIPTTGSFEDVCVTITPMGNFRSGFNAFIKLVMAITVQPQFHQQCIFYPISNVTFQSATLPPSQITPDSVLWNLPAIDSLPNR
jgi:hypothetical protein